MAVVIIVFNNWEKPGPVFDADPTDVSSGDCHPTPARPDMLLCLVLLTDLRQCQCSGDDPDILWSLSLGQDGRLHQLEARVGGRDSGKGDCQPAIFAFLHHGHQDDDWDSSTPHYSRSALWNRR